PVPADELGRGIDRTRAAAREEDDAVLDRCERGHALGEREGGPVREVAEAAAGRELPDLRGRGLGQLGAAVADVAVPERARRVEVALVRGVEEPGALAALEHDLVPRDLAHVGERVPAPRHGRPPPVRCSSRNRSVFPASITCPLRRAAPCPSPSMRMSGAATPRVASASWIWTASPAGTRGSSTPWISRSGLFTRSR